MKSLNNDWDTIEFQPTSIEQLLLERARGNIDGADPYNSGVRRMPNFVSPESLEKTQEVEIWFEPKR